MGKGILKRLSKNYLILKILAKGIKAWPTKCSGYIVPNTPYIAIHMWIHKAAILGPIRSDSIVSDSRWNL